MACKKIVPKIRFDGFDGDWANQKLGEVATLQNGYAFKSENFIDYPSTRIVLTPGNVHIGGGYQDGKGRYFDESVDVPDQYILSPDDIFIMMTDLTPTAQTLGYPAKVPENGSTFLLNQRLAKIVSRGIDSDFLFHTLTTDNYHNAIVAGASGTTVRHTSPSKILSCELFFPHYDEQAAIGNFFRNFDDTMALKKQQHEQTINIKKAMLEKMFPKKGADMPEIRLDGFTEAWEVCLFSDLASIRRGLTYSPSNVRETGIRVLRSSNIAEDVFALHMDDIFVEPSAVTIEPIQPKDILITSANGSARLIGKRAIIPDSVGLAVHGGFMLAATAKDPDFVNALMGSIWYRKFLELNVTGGKGAISNLRKTDLESQLVLTPKAAAEKAAIGNFFRNIDVLLAAQQEALEKLQNIKNACLSKMFV